MKFDQIVKLIIEDREINSPNPKIYKLEITNKGLFKRTYLTSGVITYTQDIQGAIYHNLDGPAITDPQGNYGYCINGEALPKDVWLKRRLVYDINKDDQDDALDILDI